MKAILCGYNWAGCKALDILLNLGYEVFVYTHDSEAYLVSLKDTCEKLNVPYSLENISKSNLPFKPDFIASIYYRYIIKNHIIDAVNGKIFNLHPSLLPKYRGCSSLTWAMINGEKEVGYTYHYIDAGCDTGNIILQKKVPLEIFDTQLSLYYKIMTLALMDLPEVVNLVLSGYCGTVQAGEASFYKRGCPYDAQINPAWGLDKIERFIRAMIFPPYKPASYRGKDIYSISEYMSLVNDNSGGIIE